MVTTKGETKKRAKPGAKGTGNYYRIVVRRKSQFSDFRTQDLGEPGGLERVAGHRRGGSWGTQAWLISKDDAHVSGNTLVGDTPEAKNLIEKLGSKPVHEEGDIFLAHDRRNVPEAK